ncbi:dephospho-CoA kinase [Variovorax saccharolyticus]|uniref:dephospho-CoA kinase n=1 Tax=Variovorax saccharolyticus TaxID=3053516 RepID=UPI002577A0A3|nr:MULTISPECIES: dephospho-CoA kinase [unclassified Variovorax]MDM0017996.1 dephospho-CoA kinase [Variovorax sp. J22R187]MDM0024967.1 dephospho-CoA kinase [Variovorax sp. J31P216]
MRIGLTGGIGSGKSTVSSMLVGLGAKLVDTDAIARAVAQPQGAAMPALEAEFGPAVIAADGGLDRARMRELVFADPAARRRLEAILHPLIGAECERQAATAAPGQTIVFDVPLLVESGRWRAIVDRVLVIDASEAVQLERVVARSGWTAEAVRAVIAQQADRRLRRQAADALIFNEGLSLAELSLEVQSLWKRWTAADTR